MTTKIVLLKHGLKIGEQTFKKITIREPVLGDLLNAEKVASPANPIAFRCAIIIECIDALDGQALPLSIDLLKSMKTVDYNSLSEAIGDFDDEGEG